MKKWIRLAWMCWMVCVIGQVSAHAMTLQTVDKQLFAAGPIGGDDYLKFKTAFENPAIDTVVLVNSPGGDLWTGLQVARMIAEKSYNTVAVGNCMSACSILFMAGKQRLFASTLNPAFNVIGIHGAHNSMTKIIDPVVQPQIFAFYKNRMGASFEATIVNQALYDMEDAGGMLRIPETQRNTKAVVTHCKGRQTPRAQCAEHKGHSGVSLGVLTDHALVDIRLPETMREVPAVLGKPLNKQFDSLEQHLTALAEQHCSQAACKEQVKKWLELEEHKAIASRAEGQGLAWQTKAPSAMRSFVQAIYRCNHARNLPIGLCRAESVNGYDVRGLYSLADQEHAAARQTLRVPADKFYGNEEFGGGFTSAKGYRMDHFDDITPQTLPDIHTVGTQALAQLLLSEQVPVVLDVWGGANDVLPTAKTLLNGGLAFADAVAEQAYHKRFEALLSLLAPDKNKALVFYCAGRNCWTSVNAVLRAKAAGYTQLYWYRGGYSAWKAAALPTALIDLQAVAH